MSYENNHYIPQFILRQFGDTINVYNTQDGMLKKNQQTYQIFSERKIYPPSLERDIGYKLESPFAKLFHDKLTSGGSGTKITLTRKELQLMKRFYVLETIRVASMKKIFEFEQNSSSLYASFFLDFNERMIPNQTPTDRWHRNIQVIIESESLDTIDKHPLCTYEILKWAHIFKSGYFAFWDYSDSDVDFIISDAGMTSEVEPAMLKDGIEHTKKDELLRLCEREMNIQKKTAYKNILYAQSFFHENFYMFPLSKNRMIVTVNPFFSLYDNKSKLAKPSGWPTVIQNRRLFEKNIAPKLTVIFGKPLYRDYDEFTYTVQQVSATDAEYINMLMLDRIERYMGYVNWNAVSSSIERYISFYDEIKMKPPVDYSSLFKKCNRE